KPIMPGGLIIEAMVQTGGLLLLLEVPNREEKLLFFAAVDGARFRRPVVPGDQLRLEVKVLAWRGDFCKLEGKATVDGQLAAEATLMCKMVDREPEAEARASEPRTVDAKKCRPHTFTCKRRWRLGQNLALECRSALMPLLARALSWAMVAFCIRMPLFRGRRSSGATIFFIHFVRLEEIRRISPFAASIPN